METTVGPRLLRPTPPELTPNFRPAAFMVSDTEGAFDSGEVELLHAECLNRAPSEWDWAGGLTRFSGHLFRGDDRLGEESYHAGTEAA